MASVTTTASVTADPIVAFGREAPVPLEQRFVMYDIDWDTYVAISDALTGRHVRLTYDRGVLEFMTISPTHARLSRLLGRFITVLSEEFNLTIANYGDMTCRRQDADRGMEPDECFYLPNESRVRGRQEIDFSTDPPPDLGIEIEVSRNARQRMAIYAALRVPEVWRYDLKDLTIHRLSRQGEYESAERSKYFPGVPVREIATFLEQHTAKDDNSLTRSFRAWARKWKKAKKNRARRKL